jgi:hypothetical protein
MDFTTAVSCCPRQCHHKASLDSRGGEGLQRVVAIFAVVMNRMTIFKLNLASSSGSSLKSYMCQTAVAHACNPRYSGGGDWEDHGLRPAQEKSM